MNKKTLINLCVAVTIVMSAFVALHLGGETGGAKALYMTVAVEGLVGTAVALQLDGDLPPEGAAFIDATLMWAGAACGILSNPNLDPTTKRAALAVDLVDERVAFEQATHNLLNESDIDPGARALLAPAIGAARAAARVAITEALPPEVIEGPCRSMQYVAASWQRQRPQPDN